MEANTGTLLTAVTNQEVQALSSRVMDPGRVHPIVVVSDSNELDAEHIAHALRLRCDVYQVPAKRLIDVVPARWGALSMSGCTARVFPGRDLDWRTRPDLSRFFRAGANAEDVIAAARNVVPGLAARNQASRRAAADRALSREAPQHVVWLREVHGAHALAQRLLDQSRTNPCAVVTVPFGATEPTIDAEALLAVAPGEVEVFVLPTREMTFVLTDTLGREASVFGGAGRVYPPGVAWLHDRTLAPLHLVDTYTRSQAATDRMIADVIREVGRVRVASHHSRDHHQSHSTSAAPTRPRSPLQEYIPGAVVLARVAQVTAHAATVELYPQTTVDIEVADVTGNTLDRLDDLITPDEIVAVRIIERPEHDGQQWRLSMLDVDDDESPLPAPAVRDNGEAWIALEDNEVKPGLTLQETAAADEQPLPVTRAPVPSPGPAHVVKLQHEIKDLTTDRDHWRREAQEWQADAGMYYAQARARSQELQALRTRTRTKRVREQTEAREITFANPEEQFRWLVFQEWAQIIPAPEKKECRLPAYWIGPEFLDSVDALGVAHLGKVLKATVHVLLGVANDAHKLRTGASGGAAPVTINGASCMRAPVEDNTPSARRLHYWHGSAGRLELSRVGLHDDYRPGPAPTFTGDGGCSYSF